MDLDVLYDGRQLTEDYRKLLQSVVLATSSDLPVCAFLERRRPAPTQVSKFPVQISSAILPSTILHQSSDFDTSTLSRKFVNLSTASRLSSSFHLLYSRLTPRTRDVHASTRLNFPTHRSYKCSCSTHAFVYSFHSPNYPLARFEDRSRAGRPLFRTGSRGVTASELKLSLTNK